MFAFLARIKRELLTFNFVIAEIVQALSFPTASIEESMFSGQAGGKWYRSTPLYPSWLAYTWSISKWLAVRSWSLTRPSAELLQGSNPLSPTHFRRGVAARLIAPGWGAGLAPYMSPLRQNGSAWDAIRHMCQGERGGNQAQNVPGYSFSYARSRNR
jgi:hypothetical protein